jgi:hypothetical protein
MLALVLSMLSVTTAAAQTAFTGVNVIGCKSPSDLASYHALLADAMKAVPMKPGPDSKEELEQMVAAGEKFSVWIKAHERDGSCYFFATDAKVVIDQQNGQAACVRATGQATWISSSRDDLCYRIRATDGCESVPFEEGNVEILCKKAPRIEEGGLYRSEPPECVRRHGDAAGCVWVNRDELLPGADQR